MHVATKTGYDPRTFTGLVDLICILEPAKIVNASSSIGPLYRPASEVVASTPARATTQKSRWPAARSTVRTGRESRRCGALIDVLVLVTKRSPRPLDIGAACWRITVAELSRFTPCRTIVS
jgi:hypothetical protein